MFKVLGVVAAGCAATMCAAPAVAAELTPDGPASLMNRWTGPVPMVLTPPAVLTEVRVVVAAGGRAGTVRIQGMSDGRTSPSVQGTFEAPKLGPEATLPAAPGTYTLPAPRVHWGAFYTSRIGLVQDTGGHAIVDVKPCAPQTPFADPCQYIWLDGWPGGSRGGASLTLEPVIEPDLDRDLRGDRTEDRTDLRVALAPTRVNGRLRLAVTVTNAGSLAADQPVLRASMRPAGRWGDDCRGRFPRCLMAPLAAGESRTVVLRSNDRRADNAVVSVASEGEDLAPLDNRIGFVFGAFRLVAAEQQRVSQGVKVRVSGEGAARVIAAVRVGRRMIRFERAVRLDEGDEQTVTLKAEDATLRTLRRAAKRGPLRTRITVRGADGRVAAKTTATLVA